MKRVGKPVFFIVALLILVFTYVSLFGVHGQNGDNTITYIKGASDIRWGIDINGGVEATFSPDTEGVKATEDQLNSARAIIELRMVNQNITDYELYVDYNQDHIIVRFPWKNDETSFDPESAIEELSATAMLTFREGNEYATQETDADGNPVYKTPTGNRICPRKGDGYAVVRLCGIVYCGHIFMDTNRNVFSTGILHNVFHFSLLDTTRIGITDDCAASKLNIQACAENEIKNNTNRYNSQRNPKEDLFSFAKFDMICSHFAAPPYNHLLRKHLNPETDFSIKREAPTPIMKLPMLPTSNV